MGHANPVSFVHYSLLKFCDIVFHNLFQLLWLPYVVMGRPLWFTAVIYYWFIMVALWNRADHYIFIVWFLLSSSFFPCLISAVADWMSAILHTLCGLSANFRRRSETRCTRLAENTGCKKVAKKSPSGHHCTTLSGYIFTTKALFDNWKKLVQQQYVLQNPDVLTIWWTWPTSGWDQFGSLGQPYEFQQVSRLRSITARYSSSGHQPNFVALNRGRHLYSAGRPSHWALAHILVCLFNFFSR